MGILSRLVGWARSGMRLSDGGTPAPSDDFWYTETGRQTTSGVPVTEASALTHSAVWAATRLISETEAGLPLLLYRRTDGGKIRATGHSLYSVLHDQANPEMNSFTFRDEMTANLVNCGNAFAEIVRDGLGRVTELWPIHPSRIPHQNLMRNKRGGLTYYVRGDDGTTTPLMVEDVLHLVGILPCDGWGKGVIQHARESIGLGLATESFGASFFGEGAVPGGLLEHPGRLSDEARKNLRASWNHRHQGPGKSNRLAILEEGMKYAKLSFSPEDAQFLQTGSYNVRTIARWYGVPAYLLQEYDKAATYASVEALGLDMVKFHLAPWLMRWEREINRKLLSARERKRYFAEHLLDGLLRGDTPTRTTALAQQFMNGALTLDEWRAIENRNAIPDEQGGKHYVPLNIAPVEKVNAMPLLINDPPGPRSAPKEEPKPMEPPRNGEPMNGRMGSLGIELRADTDSFARSLAVAKRKIDAFAAKLDAQAVVADAVARMLRKETKAAQRAAKKPSEFLAWLDSFYTPDHEELVRAAILPGVRCLLSVCGDGRDAEQVATEAAKAHCERSRDGLLSLSGSCTAAQLDSWVESLCKVWERDRPNEQAAELIQKEGAVSDN